MTWAGSRNVRRALSPMYLKSWIPTLLSTLCSIVRRNGGVNVPQVSSEIQPNQPTTSFIININQVDSVSHSIKPHFKRRDVSVPCLKIAWWDRRLLISFIVLITIACCVLGKRADEMYVHIQATARCLDTVIDLNTRWRS